jgi:4-alpha-glucanotransferase
MARAGSLSRLFQLAHRFGVQTAYVDAMGRDHEASPEALLKILAALGAPINRISDARQALMQRTVEEWRRVVEPVHVAWEGGPACILVRLPAGQARGTLHCRLCPETGHEQQWVCRLDDLPTAQRARLGRAVYVVKRLDLPERLPLGYHRLALELRGARWETLLLSAPLRAFEADKKDRCWGAFLPLYALTSQYSWGCGDFSDLAGLLGWVNSLGGRLVGTLPLLAAFLDGPYEPSPYSPASRLFWNELYVDVSRAPELESCPEARALMASPDFAEELLLVRDAAQVDYPRIMALKRKVLAMLARIFFEAPLERHAAFEQFLRVNPHARDYAAFRAVLERRRCPWTDWPAPLRDGTTAPGDFDEDVQRYHMYVQWLAAEQMQALAALARNQGQGMYLDLPLGVHGEGYDVWRERQAFALSVAGGAPPDTVFPRGQDWGFAPLHPEGIRAQEYRYVRACVHHQMQLAGVLRIDHMPSFHRLFWIPDGMAACHGVYVRYPSEELYAVFSLESHRHKTRLVGEDLGTVPPEVPAAMERHGLGRIYVIQYELQEQREQALPEPPAGSVASVNTHDMPGLAAFLEGLDVELRQQLGLVDKEASQQATGQRQRLRAALQGFLQDRGLLGPDPEPGGVLQACLRFLGQSRAGIVLVTLEDLWLESRPQNVPSTGLEGPNWRRKARYTLEEIERLAEVRKYLEEVNRIVQAEVECKPTGQEVGRLSRAVPTALESRPT